MSFDNDLNLAEQVNSLTLELQVAKECIKDLKQQLDCRESDLRKAHGKYERSFRRRSQRRKVSGLLQPITFSNLDGIEECASVEGSINDYFLLTLCGYSRERTSTHDLLHREDTFANSPTFVRMLEGRVFVVGPEGVTIGSGAGCGIKLHSETGVRNYHGRIHSRLDEATGERHFFFSKVSSLKFQVLDANLKKIPDTEIKLHNGSIFMTGHVRWKVSPIPCHQYLLAKSFEALRNNEQDTFQTCFKEIEIWNETLKNEMNEPSDIHHKNNEEMKCNMNKRLVDINAVENTNYSLCHDIHHDFDVNTRKLNEELQLIFGTEKDNQFTLLHVAVGYQCTATVNLLLEKGANVNLQCGSQLYTPLHIAAQRNDLNMVQLLVKHGACVDLRDNTFEKSADKTDNWKVRNYLLRASLFSTEVGEGNLERVKRMFDGEISLFVDARGFRYYSPLHLASFYGHVEVVEFLLQNKAQTNLVDYYNGRTALHFACLSNQLDVVRALLRGGCNQTLRDEYGYTAVELCRSREVFDLFQVDTQTDVNMSFAIQVGDKNLIQKLLEEDVNEFHLNDSNITLPRELPLRKTSRQATFHKLGLSGIVDQKNNRGLTPLHIAAATGNVDILRILLDHGASLNSLGGVERRTPLHLAALCGHLESVEFLLSMGATLDKADARGLYCIEIVETEIKKIDSKLKISSSELYRENMKATKDNLEVCVQSVVPPQCLTCENCDHIDFNSHEHLHTRRKMLINIMERLQSDQQKLFKFFRENDEDAIELLLRNGTVDVDKVLSKSMPITPLNFTASLGLHKMAKLLLEYDADPYIADSQSYTAIHTAAESGHDAVMRVFIQYGIDVNIQTEVQKYTALHIAALKGHINIVKILVEADGINIDLLDKNNQKAIDLTNNEDIQSLLARGDELICLAVLHNHPAKLKEFLVINSYENEIRSIDVNKISHNGMGLLHVAATHNYLEIASLLIDNSADVNSTASCDEGTPLHYACRNSSVQVCQLLLDKGAVVGVGDIHGKTPFEVSQSNEIRKLLVLRPRNTYDANLQKIEIEAEGIPNEEVVQTNEISENQQNKCLVCLVNDINTMILPCNHQKFCIHCVLKIDKCPLDRRPIKNMFCLNENNSSS